ncbi:MAG TPA: preprotein translocase subunit SecG [Myxococcales bacterium]|nr:preprotein translocase subunit SecG [Myxococcales bacterium]HIL81195.1 preprotein translocase subunit SecG [Myxococcales bacterium]
MSTMLLVLHFMVCFVLITVVLLQRGKGSDLGAALGGGGANTVFGSRGAGNFLTKLTTGSAILFMITSLSLAYLGTQQSDVQLFTADELAEKQSTGSNLGEGDSADGDATDAAVGGLEEIGLEEVGIEETAPPSEGESAPAAP